MNGQRFFVLATIGSHENDDRVDARLSTTLRDGRMSSVREHMSQRPSRDGRGGNERGAQSIGGWLRRRRDEVEYVNCMLRVDGSRAGRVTSRGAAVPPDAERVRELLRREGVRIDAAGHGSARQRFTVEDWTALGAEL